MTGARVLVTGSDGFLGSTLVNRLREKGHNVLPISRRDGGSDDTIRCDLRSTQEASLMLRTVKPDVIVNIAAHVDFDPSVPNDLFSVNSLFPLLAAQYAAITGAWLIQTSGIIVHGSHHRRFGKLTSEQPDTPYGLSKLIADNAIIRSGCGFSILRFGGIYGLTGPSHLKLNQTLRQAHCGVLPTLVGKGIALRNYIYVEDAARTIEYCLDNRPHGVFYCGGYTLSFSDMLQAVSREWLTGAVIQHVEGVDGDDQLVEISSGMPRPLTFEESLRHINSMVVRRGSTPC